jgi:hypothetical protein
MKVWGDAVLPGQMAPVPASISRRQFFQVLATAEIITKQEALDAVTTGAIPAALDNLIELFSDDENLQWQARMAVSGATSFERNNWFVVAFGAAYGLSPEEIDGLWRDGVKLD